jgi:hypothetical protein
MNTAHVREKAMAQGGGQNGRSVITAGFTTMGAALALFIAPSPASAAACPSEGPDGPMTVTPDCVDPVYNDESFVVDKVSEVASPLPHTRVDAHFTPPAGKQAYKVTFYLPPRDQWRNRFFQHAYPLEQPENVEDVMFALRNGGYLVNVAGVMCGCGGYRPDAAAAKIAKRYAEDFYKTNKRIYGYLSGGSGGGLLTSGAAEHTRGVWDGIVPYVLPNAASLANVNAIGSLAGLALGDKLATIADAVAPGSRRDPAAGLAEEQRAIFTEALALGTPLATFEHVGPFGGGSNPLLMVLTGGVKENDPTYVADFWSKPGYAGANPPGYLRDAIREEWATITDVTRDAGGEVESVTLDRAPDIGSSPLAGLSFEYWLYGARGEDKLGELGGRLAGNTIWLKDEAGGKTGQLGQGIEALMKRASLGASDKVAPGQRIKVNNLNFLALHYYHRHAMPLDRDIYTYDFLRKADGSPRYPQRSYLASPESAVGTAGGGRQTGKINTKVMVVQSMVDSGAQPWMADWYAKRVRAALGPQGYADNFRIYLNDNAGHLDIPPPGAQAGTTINYVPALRQSLLDLVKWVERGAAPPASSGYTVEKGQLILAPTAARRGGLQPVVDLTAGGTDRIEVAVNETVTFKGRVEVPPGAGKVTSTAWWFGDGPFALTPRPVSSPSATVEVTQSHSYNKPGTYFVTFWATSQRGGTIDETSTAVQNLDRVRVIVR